MTAILPRDRFDRRSGAGGCDESVGFKIFLCPFRSIVLAFRGFRRLGPGIQRVLLGVMVALLLFGYFRTRGFASSRHPDGLRSQSAGRDRETDVYAASSQEQDGVVSAGADGGGRGRPAATCPPCSTCAPCESRCAQLQHKIDALESDYDAKIEEASALERENSDLLAAVSDAFKRDPSGKLSGTLTTAAASELATCLRERLGTEGDLDEDDEDAQCGLSASPAASAALAAVPVSAQALVRLQAGLRSLAAAVAGLSIESDAAYDRLVADLSEADAGLVEAIEAVEAVVASGGGVNGTALEYTGRGGRHAPQAASRSIEDFMEPGAKVPHFAAAGVAHGGSHSGHSGSGEAGRMRDFLTQAAKRGAEDEVDPRQGAYGEEELGAGGVAGTPPPRGSGGSTGSRTHAPRLSADDQRAGSWDDATPAGRTATSGRAGVSTGPPLGGTERVSDDGEDDDSADQDSSVDALTRGHHAGARADTTPTGPTTHAADIGHAAAADDDDDDYDDYGEWDEDQDGDQDEDQDDAGSQPFGAGHTEGGRASQGASRGTPAAASHREGSAGHGEGSSHWGHEDAFDEEEDEFDDSQHALDMRHKAGGHSGQKPAQKT